MSVVRRDLIIVRHGINSSPRSMQALCDALRAVDDGDPKPEIDNAENKWKRPVLETGIELARAILTAYSAERHRRVVLIGHSQGGLVCRVAALMLAGRSAAVAMGNRTSNNVAFGRSFGELLAGWTHDDQSKAAAVAPALAGVIMLATPNAGAFTFGQLGMLGRVAAAGVRLFAPAFGVQDLPDLTTDQLPRLLQHYSVPTVKYLSISGSAINRYSRLNYDDLSEIPVVGRLGVRLEQPNDRVVEDCSVDLSQAPLPCEIEDMAAQYEHVRAYVDCTSVGHTEIQHNPYVLALVKGRMRQWRTNP